MKTVDASVWEVFEDVRKALEERELGRSQKYKNTVRFAGDVTYILPGAWQSLSEALLSVEYSVVPLSGEQPLEMQSRPEGIINLVKFFLKKLIKKATYWYVNPILAQVHRLHHSTSRALWEISDLLRVINDRLDNIEREDFSKRLEAFEGKRFDERLSRLEREWRSLSGALQTGQSRKRPEKEITESSRRIPLHERTALLKNSRMGVSDFPDFFFDYYWFESIHRGDRDFIKKRQQQYLKYFEGCSSVLDLGCGRGEFLELLKERGIGGYGVDIEPDAISYCVDSGLKAVEAEAIEHLSSLEDESLDGVFISQVIEHLTPREIIKLIGLVYRKIKPGFYVVVETPNPQCLLIFASFFYADISHVQPVHPETMKFLLLSAGFSNVEVFFTNPVPKDQRLKMIGTGAESVGDEIIDELNQNFEKLNTILFGYMDYAVVAKK